MYEFNVQGSTFNVERKREGCRDGHRFMQKKRRECGGEKVPSSTWKRRRIKEEGSHPSSTLLGNAFRTLSRTLRA